MQFTFFSRYFGGMARLSIREAIGLRGNLERAAERCNQIHGACLVNFADDPCYETERALGRSGDACDVAWDNLVHIKLDIDELTRLHKAKRQLAYA